MNVLRARAAQVRAKPGRGSRLRTGTNLHLPWSDRSRAPLALFGVFAAAVGAAIFAPYARSYFFFFDDFHLLDYAAHHSLAETFITTQHGNYRPAAFLFWKTWLRLFGVAVPAAFSSLHLVAHTLNSILLGLILLRFRSSTTSAPKLEQRRRSFTNSLSSS